MSTRWGMGQTTYEVQRCTSGENCLRKPMHLAVYTTQKLAEKAEQGLFATHNCMDPSGGNDHCVTLHQINSGDLVDHVTKPCMVLYLASGPAFVRSKIGGGGAYEEEGLL